MMRLNHFLSNTHCQEGDIETTGRAGLLPCESYAKLLCVFYYKIYKPIAVYSMYCVLI